MEVAREIEGLGGGKGDVGVKIDEWGSGDWEKLSGFAFSKPFSIWENLFRDVFNNRVKDVIESAFDSLFQQSVTHIEDHLGSAAAVEEAVGAYLWTSQSTTIPSTQKQPKAYRADGPAIDSISVAFEEALVRFRDDIQPLLGGAVAGTPEGGMFDGRRRGLVERVVDDEDAHLRAKIYREASTKAMVKFRDGLLGQVGALGGLPIDALVNRSVFIGRSARAIALKLEDNASILLLDDFTAETPTSATSRERSLRYALSPRSSETNLVDPRLTSAKTMMMDVYLAAHAAWIEYVGAAFEMG
ncbi:hypothetical protein HK097_006607, partial [Rhizophlyctis rosea]